MAQYRNVKEFTDKIRNVYNKYRTEYVEISNAILEDKKQWLEERRRGWTTAEKGKIATLKHDEEERNRRIAFESIEDRAKAEFDEIKAECMKIFEPYNRATASMIDMPTLELLKSGILKDNELIDLANDFSDNVTMLRLIGKYAEEKVKNSKAVENKDALGDFAIRCKAAAFPYIVPVENLILWSLKAMRAEKDVSDKENAISNSNAIAKRYDQAADEFTAEAAKYYITVSE